MRDLSPRQEPGVGSCQPHLEVTVVKIQLAKLLSDIRRNSKVKIVLSHPYSGAVWWWFESMREGRDKEFRLPSHGYYRTLFGNPPEYIDVALAALVIFEDIIMPAADAWYPGSNYESPLLLPNIGIAIPEWGPLSTAQDTFRQREDSFLADPVIRSILARVPEGARRQAVVYAIVDIILAAQHQAPVFCSYGRRALIKRMVELTAEGAALSDRTTVNEHPNFSADVADYVTTVGLTFRTEDVPSLARVKYQERIRTYADGFQKVLTSVPGASVEELYEKIAAAWTSSESNQAVSGSFAAASRSFAIIGLVPGAGLVFGPASLAADATAVALEHRSERQRWYELGPEISRYQSLGSLEDSLRRRRLL